jgi:hypothetical protein
VVTDNPRDENCVYTFLIGHKKVIEKKEMTSRIVFESNDKTDT